uniref:KATNIP domain-containing protein n=1 Tax=Meloidogyne floridensis TaxID=298350 RepID=A0A915NXV0_9BILA
MKLCNYRVLASVEPIHIGAHFRGAQTMAMIRIRNYSGSRIHALRGVRNLRIWLDNFCIFYGEICCAVGNSTTGDTILFTTNEEILAKIAEHDEQILQIPEQQQQDSLGDSNQHNLSVLAALQQAGFAAAALVQSNELPCVTAAHFRPTTGGYNNNIAPSSASPPRQAIFVSDGECSLSLQNNLNSDLNQIEKDKGEEEENEENKNQEGENLDDLDDDSCVGKLFHMELVESWGSADSIGLTGIQFLGPGFAPIDDNLAKECVVRCEPVVVVNEERQPAKTGDLNNYAGVRYARFYANGRPINGLGDILLRRAPGFVFFDFVQDVLFDRCTLQRPLSCARPQTRSVAAFIFQLRLLSTWGDEFYIGLNGIELFNRQDKLIRLHPQNLAAFPESVNCLTSVKDDPRTSDKLIDGCNDTNKPYHMWLTPILPNSCARIFVIFDTPTYVTRIRIYNYRKTAARGVRHIAVSISADDLLLCSGAEVPASSAEATGILDIPLRDFETE